MNRLKIAIQKSGRLSDGSFKLLKQCGLKIIKNPKRQLVCKVQNFPVDILLIRDDDILNFTSEKICDVGIIGENTFKEYSYGFLENLQVETIKKLGFSKCRLSIAIPNRIENFSHSFLKNKKIATSYPNILEEFLKKNQIQAKIIKMQGSVEAAPYLQIADAICDLVSTGSTLEENSLKEVQSIFQSEAILISHKNIDLEKKTILERFLNRIDGVIRASESKYIMLNAPKDRIEEITSLLPGSESPTITPLKNKEKVSFHAVCSEPVFWETMEKLKLLGASSILVLPIEKIME